jgi:hypothetical protein
MKRSFIPETGGFRTERCFNVLQIVGWAVLGVALAVLFALVFGVVVKLLWNWLMPPIFGLGEITYWQAFGLVILAKLLFGAFGHRHRDHSNHFERTFHRKKDDYRVEERGDPMVEGWKHYKQYWQEEGREAFDDYLRRRGEQEKKRED